MRTFKELKIAHGIDYAPNVGTPKRKEWYGQGFIHKSERNFWTEPDQVCYIPELSDDTYTRNNILKLCNDNPEVAAIVFAALDWQSPDTELMQLRIMEEVLECPECGALFLNPDFASETKTCPECETTWNL